MPDMLRAHPGRAMIELRLEPDPELWHCRVDPSQCEVALLNVLINAARRHGRAAAG